jgi:hypothetical protein
MADSDWTYGKTFLHTMVAVIAVHLTLLLIGLFIYYLIWAITTTSIPGVKSGFTNDGISFNPSVAYHSVKSGIRV